MFNLLIFYTKTDEIYCRKHFELFKLNSEDSLKFALNQLDSVMETRDYVAVSEAGCRDKSVFVLSPSLIHG